MEDQMCLTVTTGMFFLVCFSALLYLKFTTLTTLVPFSALKLGLHFFGFVSADSFW